MTSYAEKAKILVDALPYIKRLNSKTIVIKYGGSALTVAPDDDAVFPFGVADHIEHLALIDMSCLCDGP